MLRDLRHAVRSWGRAPGLFSLNIAVLATGVGVATALAAIVYTVLLRPLAYEESERLYTVWFRAPALDIEQFDQSPGTYLHFRERAESFEELGIYITAEVALVGEHTPRRLLAAELTPSVLRALRARPSVGRLLTESDARPDAEPVTLLSDRLWREQYGGDERIVGETIRIDGIERRVLGVLPSEFQFPSSQADLWMPLVVDRNALQVTNFSYRGLARLDDEVRPEAATSELVALSTALSEAYPDDLSESFLRESGMEPFLEPLREDLVGGVGAMLWTAFAAVLIVLLIAAANTANLLFVRADSRSSETALRAALGANRRRLLQRAAAEGIVLGAPAGLLGGVGAVVAVERVRRLRGFELPRLEELTAGPMLVSVALLLGVVVGLLLGLLSHRRVALEDGGESLKGTRSCTASRSSWTLRRVFVVAQVAASTALLLGAGLLIQSFVRLSHVDPGFVPERLVTLFVTLPSAEYPTGERVSSFWRSALQELDSSPGVEAVSVTSKLPFEVGGQTGTLVDGHPSPDGLAYVFGHRTVDGGYFQVSGIPLLAGRTFDERDVSVEGPVVISASLAKRFWSTSEAALDQRLRPAGTRDDGSDLGWSTVVGVVGDTRDAGLRERANHTVYFPLAEDSGPVARALFVVAKIEPGAPFDLATARSAIAAVDPNIPLASFRTGEELVRSETAHLRFTALLLGFASVTATAIGSFGLFAILLSFVTARRREIGVRLAVGATRADVRLLVARTALQMIAVGCLVGVLTCLFAERALGAFLFEVSGFDPLNVLVVVGLLVIVGLTATVLPASRAASVDPVDELRAE